MKINTQSNSYAYEFLGNSPWGAAAGQGRVRWCGEEGGGCPAGEEGRSGRAGVGEEAARGGGAAAAWARGRRRRGGWRLGSGGRRRGRRLEAATGAAAGGGGGSRRRRG